MKKLIAMILMLVFTFYGCGKNEEKPDESKTPPLELPSEGHQPPLEKSIDDNIEKGE